MLAPWNAGARVLSAETPTVRMHSGKQHGDTEVTYTYNPGKRSEHHMYVIRLFLDGEYREPPPNVLPPVPDLEPSQDDCCAIL